MFMLLSAFLTCPLKAFWGEKPGLMQINPSCTDLQCHRQLFLLFKYVFSSGKQSVTAEVPIKHKINQGRETRVFMWSGVKAFPNSKVSCCWFLSFDRIPWIVFTWVRGRVKGSREAMLYSRMRLLLCQVRFLELLAPQMGGCAS